MRKKFVLFIFGCLLTLSSSVFAAFSVPDRASGYVSDYARVLSADDAGYLDARLRAADELYGNQIVVAIFDSLQGESLEDVSMRIAEAWKIGQKGKDNGVLITVFMQDHAVRIEVGYGLEDRLTDALCAGVIANVITPAFKVNRYGDGLNAACEEIVAAIGGKLGNEQRRRIGDSGTTVSPIVALFIFIICCFCSFIFGVGGPGTTYGGGRSYGGGFSSGGGFSGGGGSFGGGGSSGHW